MSTHITAGSTPEMPGQIPLSTDPIPAAIHVAAAGSGNYQELPIPVGTENTLGQQQQQQQQQPGIVASGHGHGHGHGQGVYQELPVSSEHHHQQQQYQQIQQQQQVVYGTSGDVHELPNQQTSPLGGSLSQQQQQQSSGVTRVYQELPTPTQQQPHNQAPSGVVYQELPTNNSQVQNSSTGISKDGEIKIDPNIVSDQFPTPISHHHPLNPSLSPAPTYSGNYFGTDEKFAATGPGQGEYYSPDQKNAGGVVVSSGCVQSGGYYQQQQQQQMGSTLPLMHGQSHHDVENPVMGHSGVVGIATTKPPKRMVNCCGRQFARKTVIILSVLAALLVIIVIGLGAGLGAAKDSKNDDVYCYYC